MSARPKPALEESGCAGCRHFDDRPPDLERALPGLSSLSSAYAAVRSQDGLCALHDRYVAATSRCALHAARTFSPITLHTRFRECGP